MNYWIFKANPEKYNIDRRLMDPAIDIRWRVSSYRHDIKIGDVAFIWRAGPPRGIVAVMKIYCDPFFLPYDPHNSEWTDEYKVDGRFMLRFPTLESDYLKGIPGLENLSVFHGYQAKTNFKVDLKEGQILMGLIEQVYPDLPKIPE